MQLFLSLRLSTVVPGEKVIDSICILHRQLQHSWAGEGGSALAKSRTLIFQALSKTLAVMQGEDGLGRNRDDWMWIRSSALFGKSLYEKGHMHCGCEKSHREWSNEKRDSSSLPTRWLKVLQANSANADAGLDWQSFPQQGWKACSGKLWPD